MRAASLIGGVSFIPEWYILRISFRYDRFMSLILLFQPAPRKTWLLQCSVPLIGSVTMGCTPKHLQQKLCGSRSRIEQRDSVTKIPEAKQASIDLVNLRTLASRSDVGRKNVEALCLNTEFSYHLLPILSLLPNGEVLFLKNP